MIFAGQGVLNSALGGVAGLLSIPFQPLDLYPSQTAVLIGMVYEFLPFMILPIYTSLEDRAEPLQSSRRSLPPTPFAPSGA